MRDATRWAGANVVVLLLGVIGTVPVAQAAADLTITHDAIGCVVAGQFPRIVATIAPAEKVGRVQVFFRAAGTDHWYRAPMVAEAGAFQGLLPRPKRGLAGVEYYIEVLSDAMDARRTPEHAAAVVDGPAACRDRLVAGAVAGGSVSVGAPSGAPAVPAGFDAGGILSAGAAAASGAAVGAAAAGGLGATALVLGGVAAAGAAGAAVALGGSDSTTTATLPPALTGRWSGTLFENDLVGQCTANWRLTLDLVEDGGRLTGTMALDGISSTTGVYRCGGSPGERFDGWVLSGATISGSTVRMPFTREFERAGTITFALEGSLSPDRMGMGGPWTIPEAPTSYFGTWTATRQ